MVFECEPKTSKSDLINCLSKCLIRPSHFQTDFFPRNATYCTVSVMVATTNNNTTHHLAPILTDNNRTTTEHYRSLTEQPQEGFSAVLSNAQLHTLGEPNATAPHHDSAAPTRKPHRHQLRWQRQHHHGLPSVVPSLTTTTNNKNKPATLTSHKGQPPVSTRATAVGANESAQC